MSTANMEHVFEVASAVDVATLTSHACVDANFSIPLGNILDGNCCHFLFLESVKLSKE